jgi:predicted NAD/FAD-binding protein
MFAYPKLKQTYEAIAKTMPHVKIRTASPVQRIERQSGGRHPIRVYSSSTCSNPSEPDTAAEFDDIILCCGAEEALRMLGADATFLERRLLKNVKYYNDLIVTHEDEDYMAKRYEFHPTEDIYFIRTDPNRPRILEMSFNLSAYQPHLSGRPAIYQTIFLDDALKQHWTVDNIDPKKILKKRITRQFAHTWTHFAFWVPFVRFLQGTRHTWYAGAYTLFNTHEIAMMSGLAAADRLGAPHPFPHDPLAVKQYKTYFRLAHGMFPRMNKMRTAS